jgi:acetylornithine deacetylase/succinyl-diaminopimelate desuccinylase-like protein
LGSGVRFRASGFRFQVVDILVTVRGKQAHSSRPRDGLNAVEGAMKVLEKLRPLMPYPSEHQHPDLGRVSLTPTSFESFPKVSGIPSNKARQVIESFRSEYVPMVA